MPEPVLVDVRQRLQVVDGAHRVVNLVAAVVDRVVMGFAVARAAAVLGADDDVAAFDGLLDEREHVCAPVAVHTAVDPDHRGVALRAALLQRLEEIGRNIHVADAAAVGHLAEVHHAAAGVGVPRVDRRLGVDVALEVVPTSVIGWILTDIEVPCALGIDGDLGPLSPGWRGLAGRGLGRGRRLLLRLLRGSRDDNRR